MKSKILLIAAMAILFVFAACLHYKNRLPIVTSYFTIDNSYRGGPMIYGQKILAPHTNRGWWGGNYGGTNLCWSVDISFRWPIIKSVQTKITLDSNGTWHDVQ